MKRFLTALVLIPFFLYIVLWAPKLLFLAALAALSLLCFHEYLGIARAHFPALSDFRFGPVPYAAGLVFLIVPAPEWLFLVIATLLVMLVVLRRPLRLRKLARGHRAARDQRLLASVRQRDQLGR